MTAGRAVDVTYLGLLLGHGGDALQMLRLASGMRERGVRSRIVVPELPQTLVFQQRCEEAGLTCERSPLITADLYGARQHVPSVVRLLRSIDSPVVHLHTGNALLPATVMLALEALRTRGVLVTVHSPDVVSRSARTRLWSSFARRRLVAVVSPSRHGREAQLELGVPPERVVTIHNAIDTADFANGEPSGPRAQLGLAPGDPLVVFTSRLDPQKRPVDAVRIFARSARNVPNAVLAFVGSGLDEQATRAEAERLGVGEHVRFLGYRTDVADWLAASTVWIFPTLRENFSIALLEALAAGCAVLATDVHGNDEVLVDGANALLFRPGDVPGGAAALARLLGDEALRQRLREAARATAAGFSEAHMVDAYLELYERVGGWKRSARA